VRADHIILLHNDFPRQFGLAFMAGCFVIVGCLLSLWCTLNIRPDLFGFERFVLGLTFSFGFIMVVLTESALFTEMNVLLPVFIMSNVKRWGWSLFRLWLTVWLGNVTGMMFMGLLMNAGLMVDNKVINRLDHLLEEKLLFSTLGAGGWFQCMCSAVVGNFLIGMAAFLSSSATSFVGSCVGVMIPTIAFVAVGAQHSPANTGYTCLAWINVSHRRDTHFSIADMICWNLIPATIGNIIGGSLLCGGIMFFLHGAPVQEIRAFFQKTLEVDEAEDELLDTEDEMAESVNSMTQGNSEFINDK
jgi:formate transporter